MKRAQRPAQSLDRGDDLRILSIAASLEIAESDHLDQVVQGDGLFTSKVRQLPVEFPPQRHELLAQSLLLVSAARLEVLAILGTGNPNDPMFSAAERADESAQCGTWSLALALFAIGALTHLPELPAPGFGGGGTKP